MSHMKSVVALLVFSASMTAAQASFPGSRERRLKIMTSVFPLQQFAACIAGERGDASLLIPPGASVHTWQPMTRDMMELAGSDLFITIGADLEPWISDITKGLGSRKIKILEASSGMDLLGEDDADDHDDVHGDEHSGHHGAFDPHIWLDFDICGRIVTKIADALCAMDPEGTPVFRKNAASCRARLEDLDARYRSLLRDCPRKTLVVAGHAAFGYLARRYGLEQVTLYGLSPDSQPTPQTLMKIIRISKEKHIRAIFFESAASPDLVKSLSRELDARTLVLNPGHNISLSEVKRKVSFFDIMEANLRSLQDGLGSH